MSRRERLNRRPSCATNQPGSTTRLRREGECSNHSARPMACIARTRCSTSSSPLLIASAFSARPLSEDSASRPSKLAAARSQRRGICTPRRPLSTEAFAVSSRHARSASTPWSLMVRLLSTAKKRSSASPPWPPPTVCSEVSISLPAAARKSSTTAFMRALTSPNSVLESRSLCEPTTKQGAAGAWQRTVDNQNRNSAAAFAAEPGSLQFERLVTTR
mmetsp:Transcript_106811/g.302058  ORF Transcript_106811/g.302058 Transcript_106811/m.302058 type:complete len:217 (-) Transcript_106811:188-838(-)